MDDTIHVDQKGALGSTTTQIAVQNNYLGMTPEEASALAIKLFMENFPKLQEQAAQIACERIDEFMKSVMDKLQENKTQDYSAFADPDVQYILYEAQQKYARIGTHDMVNILSELLVQRIKCENNSTKKIIINRATEVAAFLTCEHLDTLALLMLAKHSNFHFTDIDALGKGLEYWASLFSRASSSHTSYLNSQGCLELRVIQIPAYLAKVYGFDKKEIEKICPPIFLSLNPDYGLSLIEKTIAITYIQVKTSYRFDLNSFLNC